MHTHNLDFNLPFGLGRVKADVHHEPLDDQSISLVIRVHHLPPMIKMVAPKEVLREPIRRPVKRDFIRKWCLQGLEWANEPAPGV